MANLLLLPLVMLVAGALTPLGAQRYSQFQTDLKRIFEDKEFDPAEPRNFRWLPDSASFSVQHSEDESTILICRSENGKCDEKIHSTVPIESWEWSPDGRKALVLTHSIRNWASETPTY